ncbi:MAG: DNA repair protein RecO [Candidatus Woesebacteria bacterium]|nr:DNA repair protein RecO [Candidatus Woesebacteria bacterium]
MKFRTYSSEGIILSRKNYSEADRILIVLSKHFGKLSLLAKGIRKIKSKKRGHLEIFSRVKFSAVKTNGMGIITEVETINDFNMVRTNLNKVSLAYYFCEVVNKITHEDGHASTVYGLLSTALEQLEQETELKKLRMKFIYDLLTNMGYWPIGKKLIEADIVLDDVIERKINSVRVGKKVLE